MRKRRIAASLLGIVLIAILLLCYPLIKLKVISEHYEGYGSYIIFPHEERSADLRSVQLVTQSADYRQKGFKITSVVYYPGLQQLAFGYIFNNEEHEKYDMKVVDHNGRSVAGILSVYGRDRFYAYHLQKLNFRLEEPLMKQATYTIVIENERDERLGALNFYYE